MNPRPVTVVELEGIRWTWLADPPPAMHLATPDRKHVVWLEDAGDLLFEPTSPTPRSGALNALRTWTHRHRRALERRWIVDVMAPRNWLDATLSRGCREIVVEAYCRTPSWFGVFVPIGLHSPRDASVSASIDPTLGQLVIECDGSPETRRDLAELLW